VDKKSQNKSPINQNMMKNSSNGNSDSGNSILNSFRSKSRRQSSPQSQRSLDQDKPLTPYDDRVIPTLRHTNKSRLDRENIALNTNKIEDDLIQDSGSSEALVPDQSGYENIEQEMYDPMDGTEEMSEREVREAALMNDYLGKQIVSNFLLLKLKNVFKILNCCIIYM
jgi:hypothetical protein